MLMIDRRYVLFERSSDVLFSNINQLEFWELEIFTYNDILGTPSTLLTLSHNQNIVKHYLLKRCCSFFRAIFKKFALSEREKKQTPAKMFQKGPFLPFKLDY